MTISEKDFSMLCGVVRQGLKQQSRMTKSYDSSIDRMSLSKELTRTDTEASCLEAEGQNKTKQEENLNGESYLEASELTGRPDLRREIHDIVAQLTTRVSAVEDEFSKLTILSSH
jgi:hypothetical protein